MSLQDAGKQIAAAREAAGYTQADLAGELRVDPSMVSKLENGKVGITPDLYSKIISALRSISPVELVAAIGYPVTVKGADRLNSEFTKDLLMMSEPELEALALLVRRRVRPDRHQQGRPR